MIQTADLIFSAALAILAAVGLIFQSGILSGPFRRHMFAYYTNLSNLAALIYEILFFATGLFGGGTLFALLRAPSVRYGEMLMILTTHLIYHWLLGAGFIRRSIDEDVEKGLIPPERAGLARFLRRFTWPLLAAKRWDYEDSRNAFGNAAVHYLVPLITLVRWLVFAEGSVPFAATFAWLCIPSLYLVFALLRARLGEPLSESGRRYPYRFMDLDLLGAGRFAASVALVTASMYVLGLLFFFIKN